MVNGIDLFKEHFSDYKEQYTIIGGFACDLLMTDAGLDFRQTVDIDMVIIIEALTTEFASAFWTFIDNGGYQARQRSSGQPEFYRFVNPTDPSYPKMIELFSRPQNHVKLQPNTHLMPLHIDDAVSSLSAILLNDDYYSEEEALKLVGQYLAKLNLPEDNTDVAGVKNTQVVNYSYTGTVAAVKAESKSGAESMWVIMVSINRDSAKR